MGWIPRSLEGFGFRGGYPEVWGDTVVCWGNFGIMEKKMEVTIVYWGNIGVGYCPPLSNSWKLDNNHNTVIYSP